MLAGVDVFSWRVLRFRLSDLPTYYLVSEIGDTVVREIVETHGGQQMGCVGVPGVRLRLRLVCERA
jgi:hypothetical protein